jgi:hypothetical protein
VALSAISQVTVEGVTLAIGTFLRAGQLYILWSTQGARGNYLQWKRHDAAVFTEVQAQLLGPFHHLSVVADSIDDTLVVAYDDSTSDVGASDANVYVIVLHPTTGAVLSGPLLVGKGMKPSLGYRGAQAGEIVEMAYTSRTRSGAYLRESRDGGVTWSGEHPVLTNYVRTTTDIGLVPFDDSHVSLMQLGSDARPIMEMGSYSRTRPVAHIVKHPTLADRFFVAEPAFYTGSFADNVRGALRLARDGATLYHLDGTGLGTSDALSEVVLFDTSVVPPTVVSSVHNPAFGVGTAGDDLNSFTVSPFATGTSADLFGIGTAPASFDFDLSELYAYAAGCTEPNAANGGALDVVRLSDLVRAPVISPSAVYCHAVGVGMSAVPVICAATLESGQEKLRIYTENALTPVLQATHKLPARVNKLLCVMDNDTQGRVYVSMVDRFNCYAINGLTSPIRLTLTIPILTLGSFFQSAVAANGNIVAAMGNGGVGVFDTSGGTLGQTVLSGLLPDEWSRSKAYALNALVRPTSTHPFSPYRRYFKCTTAGTSGGMEPTWQYASAGTVSDGGVVWTEQGAMDALITGVAIDQARKRIYAVGVVGGSTGTIGRLYVLDARGLI